MDGRRPLLVALAGLALAGCVAPRGPRPTFAALPDEPPPAPPSPGQPVPPPPPAVDQPAPPPAWVATPVAADATDVPASDYRVQPGDNLRRISARTGAGSEAIARENGLAAPFTLKPGQVLHIPAGRYHTVRPGQSGIAIARAYGVDWSEIVSLNHLAEPYILRAGMRILIPSSQQVASMSVEQHAAAFRLDLDDIITGGEPALAHNQKPVKPAAEPAKPLPASAVVAEPARFSGQFEWPIDGKVVARFGSLGGGRVSEGIDIAAPVGTPVEAAADGTVAYVGQDIPALGRLVLIRHGSGWITAYAHASELLVTRGQAVKRGQVIARSGESGAVEQPLLHFEIRQARAAVDPVRFLPPR